MMSSHFILTSFSSSFSPVIAFVGEGRATVEEIKLMIVRVLGVK